MAKYSHDAVQVLQGEEVLYRKGLNEAQKHIVSNHAGILQRINRYCIGPLTPTPDVIDFDWIDEEEQKQKERNKDPI